MLIPKACLALYVWYDNHQIHRVDIYLYEVILNAGEDFIENYYAVNGVSEILNPPHNIVIS